MSIKYVSGADCANLEMSFDELEIYDTDVYVVVGAIETNPWPYINTLDPLEVEIYVGKINIVRALDEEQTEIVLNSINDRLNTQYWCDTLSEYWSN